MELSKDLTPRLRIAARLAAADLFVSSHLSSSMRYAEEALEEARRFGDEIAAAKARGVLSWAHGLRGDYREAETLGTQALSVFEKVGNSWERALTLERLGEPFHDAEQSIRYLQGSLDLHRRVGDRKRQSVVLYKLASRTAQARRDFPAATEWVEESLAICDETGNIQDGAHASLRYGTILRRQGEAARAGDVLEEALEGVSVATAVSEKRSELVDTLRAALAPDELENAWRTGETLSIDEAIALATGIRTM